MSLAEALTSGTLLRAACGGEGEVSKVVVCDDDPVLRAVISEVCNASGLDVVAETDRGGDAVMMVRRFAVDVLVLDLSLVDGSGQRALALLREEDLHPAVVVFTAYAADALAMISLGAREVVQKPDFEALGEALRKVSESLTDDRDRTEDRTEDRRLASRPTEPAPPMWHSPSGLSPTHDLAYSYLSLEPGDAALAVRVLGLDAFEADVGPLLANDCRLTVARLLRIEMRIQDLLHLAPDGDGFIALLRGGDARASAAVWSRLVAVVRRDQLVGVLHGAGSRVDAHGGADAVARSAGALQGIEVGGPSFLSV